MQASAPGSVASPGPPVEFSGTIEPARVSVTYWLGLVVVSVATILVPLLYAAIVLLAAWAVLWHLQNNDWLMDNRMGIQWAALLYMTPALMGAVLVFFMIKPILVRRRRREPPLELSEREQPRLFALVREICRQVRAPAPARIVVDCQVNASASLAGGMLGPFRNELVLTIGLPLVAGLTVTELTGVLAHEFGHFAQGAGMRLTTLIRSINLWLARVVHERDDWDVKLEEWSKQGDFRVVVPMALARLSVWLSRRILDLLITVSHGISCFMLRQMEFDADSYEIKLAGSAAFTRTTARMQELSAASQLAYQDMSRAFASKLLPSDLPLLVASHSRQLPETIRISIEYGTAQHTGLFDTHPSAADRISAATAAAAPGVVVGGDAPAGTLFDDFDAIAAAATRHHYAHVMRIDLGDVQLAQASDALQAANDRDRDLAIADAYLQGRISVCRPLRIRPDEVEPYSPDELSAELARLRAATAAPSAPSPDTYRQYEYLFYRQEQASCAIQLFIAGMQHLDADRFSLAEPTRDGAQSTIDWAISERAALEPVFDSFDALLARRLACGVTLAARADSSRDLRAAATALAAFTDIMPVLLDARRSAVAARVLQSEEPVLGPSPHLREQIGRLTNSAEEQRRRIQGLLENALAAVTLDAESAAAWSTLLKLPADTAPLQFVDNALSLYRVVLLRIVLVAAAAEQAGDSAASAGIGYAG